MWTEHLFRRQEILIIIRTFITPKEPEIIREGQRTGNARLEIAGVAATLYEMPEAGRGYTFRIVRRSNIENVNKAPINFLISRRAGDERRVGEEGFCVERIDT